MGFFIKSGSFSSPCLGILFSHYDSQLGIMPAAIEFSSPCLGILFSLVLIIYFLPTILPVFAPMFGDSFFTMMKRTVSDLKRMTVFVPMFGDSFFTVNYLSECDTLKTVFVPMFGDSFFIRKHQHLIEMLEFMFSSPCLGILFSLIYQGRGSSQTFTVFSSPCLGILFSQWTCTG